MRNICRMIEYKRELKNILYVIANMANMGTIPLVNEIYINLIKCALYSRSKVRSLGSDVAYLLPLKNLGWTLSLKMGDYYYILDYYAIYIP